MKAAMATQTLGTSEALRVLANRRVYFAHQSVGGNIVHGIQTILETHANSGFKLVESQNPASVSGPAFIHFAAGRNEDPTSKNADFQRVLDSRAEPDSALVLLKYCYIDVNAGTDIDAMFRSYTEMVAGVRRKHPDVTVVHVTMPLTTDAADWKASIKRLLGRTTAREVNAKRARFNRLLTSTYPAEPVFDLAALESTHPDGRRERTTVGGEEVFALVAGYTPDGGHLTANAQKDIADSLIRTLAAIPTR